MTPKPFDFWQDHSDIFLTMAFLWDRRKCLQQPDGYGRKTGDCGETVAMYLAIRDDIIAEVAFEIDGCIHTNACCNALATLVEGKTIMQAWAVTAEDIISLLETLPEDHRHCAELTAGTFYLALAGIDQDPTNQTNPITTGETQ